MPGRRFWHAGAMPSPTRRRAGLNVVMTGETDWIGGQLTQQGVPPDEHRWIEAFGSTRWYRELRWPKGPF